MFRKVYFLFAAILNHINFRLNKINYKMNIIFRGFILIDKSKSSQLIIGNNVTLRSSNLGYHLNMYAPLKFMIDEGAVISIGDNTRLNGCCIHASSKIEIGKNCLIAANVQIVDNSGHDVSFANVVNRINTFGVSKPIKIEDNVWIGANSFILPGITIGFGSIIAAGSIVTKNIPSMCIAGGNPARVIKILEGDLK